MTLTNVWTAFEQELDLEAAHIRSFAGTKTLGGATDFTYLDECLLEGLLSRVWQTWNNFCRSCVIESCIGTTNANGISIVGLPSAVSEAHVSGAAINAKKARTTPLWGSRNTVLRNEPTWGDIDILVKVLGQLAPSNSANMMAAFSSSHRHAKALQLIRNGAAHNHAQNIGEIMTLRSSYLVFPIAHPTHALFWTAPASRDFLVMHAMQELKDAALLAIS